MLYFVSYKSEQSKKRKMILPLITSYFDVEASSTQIKKMNTHFDTYYELGDDCENGTIERVDQATNKSIEIFEKVFKDPKEQLTLIVYEFPEPNPFGASTNYLHAQLKNVAEIQKISKKEFTISILKTQLKDIAYKEILRAIVNKEMGFTPALSQIVYFFSDLSPNAFVMFDDRACQTNGI